MADPVSMASALLALAGFALQSTQALYQAVQSFQSNRRTIRELKEELEALESVLKSLQEAAINADTDLKALQLPLLRCGKACKDFEAVIAKSTAHSTGSRTSFRDWAKLTYMGEDIVSFKNMLAGYKATIAIALGDANIRAAAVTISVLKEYKEMIQNTTSDLEEHLQEIDKKLQTTTSQNIQISSEDAAERQRIQEERDSTQKCLDICTKVYTHIDSVRLSEFENISTSSDVQQKTINFGPGNFAPARQIAANTFHECKERLTSATKQLQKQLQELDMRLQAFFIQKASIASSFTEDQAAEQDKIREEIDSIKQCLVICARASEQVELPDRTNVAEDISSAEDSHQVVVATLGDLINAKRVSSGPRSVQWVGQMSDASLQQLSRDRALSPRVLTSAEKSEIAQPLPSEIQGQYGPGYKLGPLQSQTRPPS